MRAALLALVLALTGCMNTGGTVFLPTSVYQENTIDGSGVFGSFYIGPVAWTIPLRWKGHGRVVFQYPAMPHFLLEGDITWEPVYPQQADALRAEMAAGRFSFREVR